MLARLPSRFPPLSRLPMPLHPLVFYVHVDVKEPLEIKWRRNNVLCVDVLSLNGEDEATTQALSQVDAAVRWLSCLLTSK